MALRISVTSLMTASDLGGMVSALCPAAPTLAVNASRRP